MKGLSICIPVYHWDVSRFAQQLLGQMEALDMPCELRIIDDGSHGPEMESNRMLADLRGLSYQELDKNIGRARIRNLLAERARYDILLFLDCDSACPDDRFLASYLDGYRGQGLRCGGTAYPDQAPEPDQDLRWRYGRAREVQSVEERSKHPYSAFKTNSFLVPKSIMQQYPFKESLVGYGHEDTLFGLELQHNKVPIEHIDAPLLHLGLESDKEFLRKSLEATENLLKLYRSGELTSGVKLLDAYLRLRRLASDNLWAGIWRRKRKAWELKLLEQKASMRLFDMYRLGYLCHRAQDAV
jgi:glycosyltransferase involved in cell wall biosynthesis